MIYANFSRFLTFRHRLAHPRFVSYLFRGPQLSPTTTSVNILQFHAKIGETVSPYGLLCSLNASNLTQTSSDVEISTLDIELVDELVVSKIFVQPGESVKVGQPIAILSELDDDDDNSLESTGFDINSLPPPMWQAYVKDRDDSGACGCS
jgi:pyruvate/2-oxoglutarate dehydrogenase complex dihydrolipoamide acyltransferase (E2) component